MKKIDKYDFYNWAYGDLLTNNQRGHLAEYIVAKALGIDNEQRLEWDAYDLMYDKTKIEIKSSGYLQAWEQKKFSLISFSIAKTRLLNSEDNTYADEIKRQADIYIFCVLKHKDRKTVDPTSLEQWEFYAIPTKLINEKLGEQKTVTLPTLIRIGATPIQFEGIKIAVDNIIKAI